MRSHPAILLLAVLLASGLASAVSYASSQTVVWPTGVSHRTALGAFVVLAKEQGTTFDISSLEFATLDGYATGSCESSVPPPSSGELVCGTDRDDDGLLTNADPRPTAPDLFDDDFVTGPTDVQIPFCFRRDVPLTVLDWDDVSVFVEATVPDLNAEPGYATVTLYLTTQSSACQPSGHLS